ncbi:MAG: hypothetical protein K2V38_00260 [Gemmataceae bacterium]|nr:hypothetical protein [Gemmataceae bacterium]
MFLTGRKMPCGACLTAAFLTTMLIGAEAIAAPVPAAVLKEEAQRLALVGALAGASYRGGPCQGEITLRADGTFDWNGIGPGGDRRSGTWAVRGLAREPVVVLTCTAADSLDDKGREDKFEPVRTNGKLIALRDRTGADNGEANQDDRRFERLKKGFWGTE